jgi:hypothetical protein
MKKSLFPLFLALGLLAGPTSVWAQDVRAGFDPNVLVPDARFNDTQSLDGAEGVQKFLESKGSLLANTAPDFLIHLNEPSDPAVKLALGDPEWNLGRLRTAAELIWDASQASGLNPQVILVMLNKEQGLVTTAQCTDSNVLQRELNHAMGFACPDGSGCGNLFPGFYYQLFGNVDTDGNKYLGATKSLMRSFNTPGGRGPNLNGAPAQVGDQVALGNTLGGYDGIASQQTVTIGNRATAALYRYTPHVFNGNYNFWNFFTSWFKYPNGTLIASTLDGITYVIEDGSLQRVPSFVAVSRQLDLSTAIKFTPVELADYPTGPAYGPIDGTVITAGNRLFAFLDGIMHPVTGFVLAQRKLDANQPLTVAGDEFSLFAPGPQLTPTDGTVLRGLANPDVYLVVNGTLKKFSAFTFKQLKAEKSVQSVTDDEVAIYPKQGYVAPLAGTLIKPPAGEGAYVMDAGGERHPLTPELFKNLGYKSKNVVALETMDEIASFPLGAPATPKEGTYFSIGGGSELYLFKNGAKHPVYPFVAKQRGVTADYNFEAGIVSGWSDGIAVAPKDGTLVKSASATVYVVTQGQLHEVTTALAKNLGLNLKKAITLPDYQVDSFAQGGYAEPKDGTYFQTKGTKNIFLFKQGLTHQVYPLVAIQRGIKADVTFDAAVAADWTPGDPVAFRDATLVKGDGAKTVYLVSLGKLRPLTDAAFKKRGYKTKNVKVVPQAQLDAFPKGSAIAK